MADIKQAAKWMQEGKKVKRHLWIRDQRIGHYGDGDSCVDLFYSDGRKQVHEPFVLMSLDLLADDWEIAQ